MKKKQGMLLMRQGLRRSREIDAPKKLLNQKKVNVKLCKHKDPVSESTKPSVQTKVKIKPKPTNVKVVKEKPIEKKKTPVTNLSCNLSHTSKVSSRHRLRQENTLSCSRNVMSSTKDSFGLHHSYNNYRSFTRPLSPAPPEKRQPEISTSGRGVRPNIPITAVCSPVSIL